MLFFSIIVFVCVFFGLDILTKAFGTQRDVYVINGILNYWAIFSGFLSSLIIIYYCIVEILKRKPPVSFLREGILVSCVIIAPLLSFALKEMTLQRTSGYVECKSLHKISSRFSSTTYAVNNESCIKLEEKKKAP